MTETQQSNQVQVLWNYDIHFCGSNHILLATSEHNAAKTRLHSCVTPTRMSVIV